MIDLLQGGIFEKKIAIVSPGTKQAVLDELDDSWAIWGINSAHRKLRARWGLMFNLHRYAHLERDCPEYIDWDADFSKLNPSVPIVVIDDWGGRLKNQVIFPGEGIASTAPRGWYHASSFDWLVATSVWMKADQILIAGTRFALDGPGDEPISAQACLEYWCGYAEGRGCRIVVGGGTTLFKQYHIVESDSVYGYDDVCMVERR